MLMTGSVFVAEAYVWVKDCKFRTFVGDCDKEVICDLTGGLIVI